MKMKVTLVAIVDVGEEDTTLKEANKLAKTTSAYTVQHDGNDGVVKKLISVEPAKGKDLTL